MVDVWKIGQDVKADEFYKNTKSGYVYSTEGEGDKAEVKKEHLKITCGNIIAANTLTTYCNEMAKTYDKIIEDQNDYLIEIDASLEEISKFEGDLAAKIKKLQAEIDELLEKQEAGTITEEENAQLKAKNSELISLSNQGNSELAAKNKELTKTTDKTGDAEREAKSEIATNYGETAIEKGQALSETQDESKTFWRKLIGSWNNQATRDAGKELAEAGNSLLDQVCTSSEIAKKTKKSV